MPKGFGVKRYALANAACEPVEEPLGWLHAERVEEVAGCDTFPPINPGERRVLPGLLLGDRNLDSFGLRGVLDGPTNGGFIIADPILLVNRKHTNAAFRDQRCPGVSAPLLGVLYQ